MIAQHSDMNAWTSTIVIIISGSNASMDMQCYKQIKCRMLIKQNAQHSSSYMFNYRNFITMEKHSPIFPATLLTTTMIQPSFCSNMWGRTTFVIDMVPIVLSSMTALSTSTRVSFASALWERPALLTRMSIYKGKFLYLSIYQGSLQIKLICCNKI